MSEEKRKILIAEDNVELSDMARNFLMKADYTVFQAFDGKRAIEMARSLSPDLLLLDIMLPICDGFEVCRSVRMDSAIPIIVISANVTEEDKIKMLEAGADDYMTKPFSFKEMVVRVGAQLRRFYTLSAPVASATRTYGALQIDSERMEAKGNGALLPLTAKEFKMLDVLTRNAGRVFSKRQLIDDVWGLNEYIDENTVAVTVARLREKLKKAGVDNLETVWGFGYKWKV